MNPLRSLRSRVIVGMVILITLVLLIALSATSAVRSLSRTVVEETNVLLAGADAATARDRCSTKSAARSSTC
jgi:hypothetical protein